VSDPIKLHEFKDGDGDGDSYRIVRAGVTFILEQKHVDALGNESWQMNRRVFDGCGGDDAMVLLRELGHLMLSKRLLVGT